MAEPLFGVGDYVYCKLGESRSMVWSALMSPHGWNYVVRYPNYRPDIEGEFMYLAYLEADLEACE